MGLDSVELLLAIEDEFGIDIPDERAATLYTVGEAFEYIRQHFEIKPSSLTTAKSHNSQSR
jgi:acyl carrier protein